MGTGKDTREAETGHAGQAGWSIAPATWPATACCSPTPGTSTGHRKTPRP